MPLTEITTRQNTSGETIESRSRQLYSLAELKALDEDDSDEIKSGAYATALDQVAQFETEWNWWESSLDGDVYELWKACGITYAPGDVHFDLDRGSFFSVPKNSALDDTAFLKAFQVWLSGRDVRQVLPDLRWGDDGRKLAAVGTQVRRFDLRSREARNIRENGLTVRVDYFGGGSERASLSFDYVDGLSSETVTDLEQFFEDLCGESLALLRAELEYRQSEASCLEAAEANEWTFDREGRIA